MAERSENDYQGEKSPLPDDGASGGEAQPPPYEANAASYYGAQGFASNQNYANQNFAYDGKQTNMAYPLATPGTVNQQPGVVMTMPTQGYVIQPVMHMERPPSYLALSCIVFWILNLCFGAVAMGFSFASQSAADRGQMETARSHGKTAKILSIIGAVLSVFIIIVFVILYTTEVIEFD